MKQDSEFQLFLKQFIKALVSMLEERDFFIRGHSERVASNSVYFAKRLSLSRQDLDGIYLGAMLHDIGMLYVPLDIIHKPSELTEDEMAIVRQHTTIASDFISHLSVFHKSVKIIRHHHEHIDGSGYPDGLRGDEIPLGARILCLADSYDAMTSSRPHRPALSHKQAMEEIIKGAGKRYDAALIKDFVAFINSTSLQSGKDEDSGPISKALNDIVQRIRKGNIDLPVLPTIMNQVRDAVNAPNSTAETLSKVLETDGAISIRIISVANSAIYRGIDKVYSVQQAVTRLGIREVQSIVTAIVSRNLYETENKDLMGLMENLWQHSLACAFCSRLIAEGLILPAAEQYFIMGLLHDIGKNLVLKTFSEAESRGDFPEGYNINEINTTIHQAHTRLGGILLQRWGFEKELIKVAELHESNSLSADTDKGLLIVHAANMLTRKIGFSLYNDDDLDLDSIPSAKLLGLDAAALSDIGAEAIKLMHLSMNLFQQFV